MHRLWAVLSILLAACTADPAALAENQDAPVTGNAATTVDVPPGGRLASELILATETGITARIAADTLLTMLNGEPVAGRYRLALDDGGGPAAHTADPRVVATLRLHATAEDSGTGTELLFDPPVTVSVDLGEPGAVAWALYGFAAAGGYQTGGDTSAPAAGPAPDDLFLAALPIVPDGPESFELVRTDVVGFAQHGDAQLAGLAEPPNAVTATVNNLAGARIRSIVAVAQKTGQPVVTGFFPLGLAPGDTSAFIYNNREYQIRITEETSPEWNIEFRSHHANVFSLSGTVVTAEDAVIAAAWEAEGGSVDEVDEEGDYLGYVLLRIRGIATFDRALELFDDLRDVLPFPTRARILGMVDEDGRRDVLIELHNYPDSIRLLPLPLSWCATRTNRYVDVLQVPADNPIVFSRDEVEVRTEYYTTDGGTPIQQAAVLLGGAPKWSPRGDAFAFATQDQMPPVRIQVVDYPSGETRVLNGTEDVIGFTWKPDGSGFAFVSRTRTIGENPTLLRVVDRDGGNLETLLTYEANLFAGEDPAWSPDGRRIAFVRGTIANGAHIHVLTLGEADSVAVTSGAVVHYKPVWAPKGDLVAFGDGVIGNPGFLAVANVATGETTRVSNEPLERFFGQSFSWSPDGREIAFSGGPFNTAPFAGIHIARADGSGSRVLVDSPDVDRNPVFSPDGLSLVYTRQRLDTFEFAVFTIDAAGLVERRESDFSPLIAAVDW